MSTSKPSSSAKPEPEEVALTAERDADGAAGVTALDAANVLGTAAPTHLSPGTPAERGADGATEPGAPDGPKNVGMAASTPVSLGTPERAMIGAAIAAGGTAGRMFPGLIGGSALGIGQFAPAGAPLMAAEERVAVPIRTVLRNGMRYDPLTPLPVTRTEFDELQLAGAIDRFLIWGELPIVELPAAPLPAPAASPIA